MMIVILTARYIHSIVSVPAGMSRDAGAAKFPPPSTKAARITRIVVPAESPQPEEEDQPAAEQHGPCGCQTQ